MKTGIRRYGVWAGFLIVFWASLGMAEPSWKMLEPGLEYAAFPIVEDVEADGAEEAPEGVSRAEQPLVALRFDPRYFSFRLYCAGQDGQPARTLEEWARAYGLVAAINAGMYLPDGLTSTGYMRAGAYINNPRIVQRFGAFFVAGPRREGLPSAALLDRDADPWEELLPQYDVVVQNYRMITTNRHILWSPGGPLYSISAVGQDTAGHILFLHCREPIDAHSFTAILMRLDLKLRSLMYVEGGGQAGLLLRTADASFFWQGRPRGSFWISGMTPVPLPNILGVLRTAHSP